MKTIGLIAEYNPFHLGHLYQIDKIKELYPDALIIAIISPTFTERGEISVINKWDKTRICLEYGIDLVIELPTLYAIQSADVFAHGALGILNNLKIDTLVFGSESDDVSLFTKLAKIQLCDETYDQLVNKYLEEGINYPTAMSKALETISGVKIDKPNDLLALSYIKEIIKCKYDITPISIKRTNNYHGKEISSNIINASLIRSLLAQNNDISKYVPELTYRYLYRDVSLDKAYPFLRYNIINNIDNLNNYLTVAEGIENRIVKAINVSHTWQELVMNIKSKRYTYNKLNRMLIQILLNLKKEDNIEDLYIRILGFNQRGRKYLNTIKKKINIPVFTAYKTSRSHVFDLEFRATYIYSLIVDDISLIIQEYKNKPIIKD